MKTTFLQSLLHLPVLNTILLLIAFCSGVRAQTITWQENWESPAAQDDWYADLGLWEIGRPTSGLGPDHGGSNCAATVLDGDYPEDRRSRLVSAPILVPVAELNPRLRFRCRKDLGITVHPRQSGPGCLLETQAQSARCPQRQPRLGRMSEESCGAPGSGTSSSQALLRLQN